MPAQRFVVVSAPLEERVASSFASRAQGAVAGALRLGHQVNATLQREDLNDKATEALSHVARPGGLPFILFMLLVAVMALCECCSFASRRSEYSRCTNRTRAQASRRRRSTNTKTECHERAVSR